MGGNLCLPRRSHAVVRSGRRAAAAWLREQGAEVVDAIEDPDYGHGALHLNARNARRVLDLFLRH
jgi:hypothetical protein